MTYNVFGGTLSSINQSADLVVPATRRSTLGRAFAVAGPCAWNSLSDAIRHNSSLAVFKRSLKTYLFTQSFNLLLPSHFCHCLRAPFRDSATFV